MAFTASEQELYDFARNAIPAWLFQVPRSEEVLTAFVKIFDRVRMNYGETRARTLILQATGVWLDLHASDRGTQRQDGETNEALRARIRNVEEAVTRIALLAAAQAIVDAELIAGTVYGVDLHRDRAYFGSYTARTGVSDGGTFVDAGGGLMEFTPVTLYALPVELFSAWSVDPTRTYPRSGASGNPRITISGATSGGNNGTFEVTALVGDAVQYTNASGVAEVDAGLTWSLDKHDIEGNSIEGRRRAYFGRGYRMTGTAPPSLVIILPFGCTAGTLASVQEMARQKKAFGINAIVECNTTTGAVGARIIIDTITAVDDVTAALL